MKTIDKKAALCFGLVGMLLSGILALMNLSEWYTVAIIEHVDSYPFEQEGPAPYYYRTATLYAVVTFLWGIGFLANLIHLVWSLIKDHRLLTVLGFALSLVLFLVMFLHGWIGAQ